MDLNDLLANAKASYETGENMNAERAGQTTEMVKAIPDTGATIVVHIRGMRVYIERLIVDLRGYDVAKKVQFVTVTRPEDIQKLHGRPKPILVDHAWWREHGTEMTALLKQVTECL